MEKMNANNGSFSNLINKCVLGSCALLMTLGSLGSVSADFDPSCHPYCDCEMNDFSVYADFIYWQVNPEGMEFARFGGVGATSITNLENLQGHIVNVGCDFQPGFRIGGNLDLGCCEWDAFAQYTYLVERRTKNDSPNELNNLVPLIFNLGGTGNVNFAKGDWHSDFNAIDFGIGKSFNVHCCYAFRPFFGFKATWQDYKYDVTYDRIVNSTSTNRDRILRHSEFDGIGLRGGFNADWKFSPCMSFIGGMAFSTLYTDYSSERIDLRIPVSNDVEGVAIKNVDLKESFCALIPVLEINVGIKFVKEICDSYTAFVSLGYEAQVWYDALRFIQIENASGVNNWTYTQSNLTFHGLVLRAGVSY